MERVWGKKGTQGEAVWNRGFGVGRRRSLIPPGLLFFFKIDLAIWGLLCPYTHFEIFFLIL